MGLVFTDGMFSDDMHLLSYCIVYFDIKLMSNVILIGTASFAFMYNPPHSTSAADCMTDLIILADTNITQSKFTKTCYLDALILDFAATW